MQQQTKTIKETKTYTIYKIHNNIATIKTMDGKLGLMNTKLGKMIEEPKKCSIGYYESLKLYFITQKINNEEYLTIYDPYKNERIANNLKIIYSDDRDMILKDEKSNEFYIYHSYLSPNKLIGSFKNVEVIAKVPSHGCEYPIFKVEEESGVRLYKPNHKGFYEGTYDSISLKDNIAILKKNNKVKFLSLYESEITCPYYDDIKIAKDNKNKTLLYLKDLQEKTITVYKKDGTKLVVLPCEEINDVYAYYDGNYYTRFYQYKSNNKLYLVRDNGDNLYLNKDASYKAVFEIENNVQIEKIEIINTNEIFYKQNGLWGISKLVKDKIAKTDASYESIYKVSYNTYILSKNHKDQIAIFDGSVKVLVDECNVISNNRNALIFKKGKEYGILNKSTNEIKDGLDNATYLKDDLVLTEKQNKKGLILIHSNGIYNLLENTYINIEIAECKYGYYIKAKKENGKSDLYKYEKYATIRVGQKNILKSKLKSQNNITFFKSIIVVEQDLYVDVFDYELSLLKSFPKDTQIEYIEPKKYTEIDTYIINGSYYYKQEGENFTKAHTYEQTLYMASFETEFGTIVVNSYSKDEFDKKCSTIEKLSYDEVNNILKKFFENNTEVEEIYPELIRKLNKKL